MNALEIIKMLDPNSPEIEILKKKANDAIKLAETCKAKRDSQPKEYNFKEAYLQRFDPIG
jgi:hypothetical protein